MCLQSGGVTLFMLKHITWDLFHILVDLPTYICPHTLALEKGIKNHHTFLCSSFHLYVIWYSLEYQIPMLQKDIQEC